MNNNNKAVELARAATTLIWKHNRFREAQHSVIFQLSNPSLGFAYEFERAGKEMEKCRMELADAIKVVDELSFDILFENRKNQK